MLKIDHQCEKQGKTREEVELYFNTF